MYPHLTNHVPTFFLWFMYSFFTGGYQICKNNILFLHGQHCSKYTRKFHYQFCNSGLRMGHALLKHLGALIEIFMQPQVLVWVWHFWLGQVGDGLLKRVLYFYEPSLGRKSPILHLTLLKQVLSFSSAVLQLKKLFPFLHKLRMT